ncbi:hypothetical protein A0256_23105 [Mucilaginibacter sp. PAMC 26640]|nr:hypothetical protein A0256_23105 [Mucilaginibacter sp. PAMC 26640]
MAGYKINGYDLQSALGIIIDQDRATADSFEGPSGTMPVFSKDWGNGVVEYDLTTNPAIKPRVFTIKGTLVASSLTEYYANTSLIASLLHQNYVTLTQIESGIKVNARVKDGDIVWHRLTNLDNDKILASFTWQFDEVKQSVPFKGDAYLIYFGLVSTVPTTSEQVTALSSQDSSNPIININTGTTLATFVFAIPAYINVLSIVDQTISASLNYTPASLTVNGKSYVIYSLSQYTPYLVNHIHKITLQNG